MKLVTDITEEDAVEIYEIEGPPVSHFEIPIQGVQLGKVKDLIEGRYNELAAVARIHYRTIGAMGLLAHEDAVKNHVKARVELIRARLETLTRELGQDHAIIWWRRHLTRREEEGKVKYLCRFDTSPALPPESWAGIERSDRQLYEMVSA